MFSISMVFLLVTVLLFVLFIMPFVLLYSIYVRFRSMERIQYYMFKDDYTDAFCAYDADMAVFKRRMSYVLIAMLVCVALVVVFGVISSMSLVDSVQSAMPSVNDAGAMNWNYGYY